MANHYDVIVVGGGVVGASTAYHLVKQGATTLLVDRHDRGRATDAGAGILAPQMNKRDPDPWYELAVKAVGYYPELVAALGDDGAGETSYEECGMLLVAMRDEAAHFDETQALILERQRIRGDSSPDMLFPVTPQEAKDLFPALADVYGALYYRLAARVDGRLLGQALRRGAQQDGLHVLDGSASDLILQQSRVTGVVVNGDALSAAAVVIAGGAWSANFGQQVGVHIAVQPQRGQIAHLDLPGQETARWPIVSGFQEHYIVCWPGGRVVAGATRESGLGYEPYTSASGVHEVLGEALRLAPGLASARLHEVRVGLRPLSMDGLPIIGRVPGVDGLLLATGHGPTGLQLGPYTGKIVAGMALGGTAQVNIEPFDVARFM